MAKKVIYILVAAVGIAAASGAAWWLQKPKSADLSNRLPASPLQAASSGAGATKLPSVEVGKVEFVRLVDDTQAVGSLRSRRGVVLRPEVSGRITQLNFTDGQRVRKGQVLVQFDDQLPLAQVQQSQAELSIAQANQKRNQELVAQNFVSQRSLDESAASLKVAEAKLALAQATAARLKILAPFDAIAGIRLVNVGDYLKDGADIVNIEDIDALFVDFRLPEQFQSKVQRGQVAMLDIDALPGRRYSAQIQAIDPLIDANGRSIGVRGCVDNRQLQLRPGMFARVTAVFGVRENARVIPEEAIVPQGGKQFVIKLLAGPGGPTDTIRISQRVEVKVGLRSPGKVEVIDGLQAGDTVVTAGQQRVLKDGTSVTVADLSAGRSANVASRAASAPGAAAGSSASSAVVVPRPAASGAVPSQPASSSPGVGRAAVTSATNVAGTATKPSGPSPCGVAIAANTTARSAQ